MKKKYISGKTQFNYMRNSEMSIVRSADKTIKEGWTKEQFEKSLEYIFDSKTFKEYLTQKDRARLVAFRDCATEYICYIAISLYKINDKLYNVHQLIDQVDGLEPSMASVNNHGFYHKMPDGSFKLFY